MSTKIKFIKAGTETLSLFVPARYLYDITAENSLFFAAFSDDVTVTRTGVPETETSGGHPKGSAPAEGSFENMCGVVLYRTDPANHHYACLKYIFVKEEFRSKGVAKTLLTETLKALKSNRKTTITCRIYTDSATEESGIQSLLGQLGFKPSGSRDITAFSMASLLDAPFTPELMEKLRPFINNVKRISEIAKDILPDFSAFLEKNGRSANLRILDPWLTRYYVEDGKIIGYAAIRELQPEILLIEDTLTLHSSISNRAIPSIIAELLEYYLDYMYEEAVLAVDIDNKTVRNAMISKFGEPAMVKGYIEYCI